MWTSRHVLAVWAMTLSVMTMKASAQDPPVCDLDCEDTKGTKRDTDGNLICIQGQADFSEHVLPNGQVLPFHVVKTSPGGFHCVCEEGFTGLKCKRGFETCVDQQRADNRCYHQGTCVDGLLDAFGNEKPFCDCRSAADRDGFKQIGKYCDRPVDRCEGPRPMQYNFCVNGGDCRNKEDEPEKPCACPSGTHGDHCEITDKSLLDTCTLRCQNKGVCKRGFKDFSQALLQFGQTGFYEEDDYQYCECPEGVEGALCEFELTEDGERKCGPRFACQNGGVCVTLFDEDEQTTVERCDCTNANNGTHVFGGKICQHASSSFCSLNVDQNGKQFCVNGGSCREGGSDKGCDCPAGFTGNRCEIILDGTEETAQEVEEEAKCELDCGDGSCRKGVKDLSLLEGFGDELGHIEDSTNQSFQHCVCPTGFVGPRCEFKVEICGEGEHLCFHGSKCVKDGDDNACDCDQAFNSLTQFAGAFCQHEASSFCTESGTPATGGQASKAFCVNGGVCKGKIKDGDRKASHPGCKCTSEFEGDHCEFKVDSEFNPFNTENESSDSSSDGGLTTAGKWMVSLFSVGIVAVFAIFVVMKTRRGGKGSSEKTIGMPAPAPTSGPVLNMGPDKDADGNEVTDVEII